MSDAPRRGRRIRAASPSLAPWEPEQIGMERRTVLAGGHRVSYLTGGSGFPVVLIHGIGSDATIWRHTLHALAPHFTVYAPDLLGCGLSDKPDITYTIDELAASVSDFMDAAGIERAHIIGHSLGGGVALKLHTLQPERFARLGLVASGGLGRELHWLLRINALPGADGVLRVLTDPRSRMPSVSLALQRRHMQALRDAYDAEMPTILHRLRDPRARLAFVQMARAVCDLQGQTISALPHLPEIEGPVLIVWGARDGILPVAHGYRAVRLLRNGRLYVLPRSKHRPQVDEPERFNAMLLDFLLAEAWQTEQHEPRDGDAAYETLVELADDAIASVGRGRRLRHARVAMALAAVGLAAGAGWRYAPRSRRLLVARRSTRALRWPDSMHRQ